MTLFTKYGKARDLNDSPFHLNERIYGLDRITFSRSRGKGIYESNHNCSWKEECGGQRLKLQSLAPVWVTYKEQCVAVQKMEFHQNNQKIAK